MSSVRSRALAVDVGERPNAWCSSPRAGSRGSRRRSPHVEQWSIARRHVGHDQVSAVDEGTVQAPAFWRNIRATSRVSAVTTIPLRRSAARPRRRLRRCVHRAVTSRAAGAGRHRQSADRRGRAEGRSITSWRSPATATGPLTLSRPTSCRRDVLHLVRLDYADRHRERDVADVLPTRSGSRIRSIRPADAAVRKARRRSWDDAR